MTSCSACKRSAMRSTYLNEGIVHDQGKTGRNTCPGSWTVSSDRSQTVTSPLPRDGISRIVARSLLDAGCVQFRTDEPFRLPSGWASPVYMDCRRLISFPRIRRQIVEMTLNRLRQDGCLDGVDSIVGAEASGIALAAWIADALALPMQYVRKKPVGQTQVEGVIMGGERVLLVDDLMAAGHTIVTLCSALEVARAKVKDVFVVFAYGTFPTDKLLAPLGVAVHALATWQDVLRVGRDDRRVDPRALGELEEFLSDPPRWSQAHSGIAISPLDSEQR
jgi:orotate phosphoribosyltransferase